MSESATLDSARHVPPVLVQHRTGEGVHVYLIWAQKKGRRTPELRWQDQRSGRWIYRNALTSDPELAERRRVTLEERLRQDPRAGDGRSSELWDGGPFAEAESAPLKSEWAPVAEPVAAKSGPEPGMSAASVDAEAPPRKERVRRILWPRSAGEIRVSLSWIPLTHGSEPRAILRWLCPTRRQRSVQAQTFDVIVAEERRAELEARLRKDPHFADGKRRLWAPPKLKATKHTRLKPRAVQIAEPSWKDDRAVDAEWRPKRKSAELNLWVTHRRRAGYRQFAIRWRDPETGRVRNRDIVAEDRVEAWKIALEFEAKLLADPDAQRAPLYVKDELAALVYEDGNVEPPSVEEMDPALVERLDRLIAERTEEIRRSWSDQDYEERAARPGSGHIRWQLPAYGDGSARIERRGSDGPWTERLEGLVDRVHA